MPNASRISIFILRKSLFDEHSLKLFILFMVPVYSFCIASVWSIKFFTASAALITISFLENKKKVLTMSSIELSIFLTFNKFIILFNSSFISFSFLSLNIFKYIESSSLFIELKPSLLNISFACLNFLKVSFKIFSSSLFNSASFFLISMNNKLFENLIISLAF